MSTGSSLDREDQMHEIADQIEAAVDAGDEAAFADAFQALHDLGHSAGREDLAIDLIDTDQLTDAGYAFATEGDGVARRQPGKRMQRMIDRLAEKMAAAVRGDGADLGDLAESLYLIGHDAGEDDVAAALYTAGHIDDAYEFCVENNGVPDRR